MSFPRYEKYKDSGVEWLGEVPEGWEVVRLQDVSKEDAYSFVDGPFGSDLKNNEYTESGVPLIQLNNIVNGRHELNEIRFVSEVKADCLLKHNAFPGDIVIAKMAEPVARAAVILSDFERYVIVADCIRLSVPQKKAHVPFIVYVINSDFFRANAECVASGITRLRVNLGAVKKLRFALPVISEQQTIAAFLDRETGKIDTLVAEQERLIELLKEKRQAVISHVVTKGLDPDASMKDSGIEWLGEVPEGWEVRKLNRLSTKIGDGLHGTPIYVDESDYYFINGNNLMNGSILVTDTTRNVAEEEYENHFIEMDDNTLLMSINGTVGNLAFYNGERIVLGKSAAYINCSERISRIFLSYYLQSSAIRTYIDLEVTGTTIFNFSLQSIRTLLTVLPPPDEQYTITAFLDTETAKIDTLITEAQQAILLLKERRSALISAAVTGKIDVRNMASTI